MTTCIENRPPLFQTDRDRVAACFLHRDAPAIKTEEMGKVFVAAGAPTSGQ